MDGRRLDDLAHALATGVSRRRAVLGAVGLGATGVVAAFRAGTSQVVCKEEGAPCTLWVACCEGLTCVGTAVNPNNGVCVAGLAQPRLPDEDPNSPRTPTPTKATGSGNGQGGQTPTATATTTTTTNSTSNTTPTTTPTVTATPTEDAGEARRRSIRVEADCEGSPDKVRIENRGDVPITIETITARYSAGSSKEDRIVTIGRIVEGERATTFEFGPGSGRDGLTHQELFSEGESGSIEVDTSAGFFRVSCEDTAPPERHPIEITLNCSGNLETTHVKNTGSEEIRITSIGSIVGPSVEKEPFQIGQVLKPGQARTFVSGPDAKITDRDFLVEDKIYADDPREGAVIRTPVGRFSALCFP